MKLPNGPQVQIARYIIKNTWTILTYQLNCKRAKCFDKLYGN